MRENKITFAGKLWHWIAGHVIQDVPVELGACEFDCSHENCFMKDWENCANRKKHIAAAKNVRE